jgi:SAM-dependent methyltransferase
MITNDAVYRLPEIVKDFQGMAPQGMAPDGLWAPERYCLDFVPVLRRHSILDIGVGTGRTTGPLSKMFEKYIGIDYSDNMIAAAKMFFPGVDLRTMDARKLDFSEPFDCVMFSFNGIDYVDYAERQLILCQVTNALQPGGYFIYSTHNLHWARSAAFLDHFLVRELVRPRWRVRSIVRSFTNRLYNFKRQAIDQEQGYAYINDFAAEFRLLTTYVNIGVEVEVLRRYGLNVVATIGNAKQTAGYDASDGWVYIVANRP